MTTLTIPTQTITTTVLATISAITTATITKTQNITTTETPAGDITAIAEVLQILEFVFSIIITIVIEGAICFCMRKQAVKDSRKNLPPSYTSRNRGQAFTPVPNPLNWGNGDPNILFG
jgi:formate hydrogenlyase subunit 3/multisubunit Na+/H+ antiporter MnhD subunit